MLPHSFAIEPRIIARFIAKIGYEIYIQSALKAGLNQNQILDALELKDIRHFVRRGDLPTVWPVSRRRIYDEDKSFEEGDDSYQVVHEYSLLATNENEIYAVIAIFGEEFAINLGGPSIEGYERWLIANDSVSPLYVA